MKFTNAGQSLYEVIFALGIAALVLTGIVSLAATSVRNSAFTRNNAQATKYAQEATEWLRGERDADWGAFVGIVSANAVYCLDDSPLNPGSWSNPGICGGNEYIEDINGTTIFLRQVTFACFRTNPVPPPPFESTGCSDPSVDNVEVAVSVSWNDAQGTHEVKSITRLTNWPK